MILVLSWPKGAGARVLIFRILSSVTKFAKELGPAAVVKDLLSLKMEHAAETTAARTGKLGVFLVPISRLEKVLAQVSIPARILSSNKALQFLMVRARVPTVAKT